MKSYGVSIHMKTTEHYLPLLLYITLLLLWTNSLSVTIQMKVTEQHFTMVLFIMLYKVVLTSESADKVLWCDHSNGRY